MNKLSIIIPVYNEEKTLLEILNRINKVKLGDIKKEIIIVDDFSTDSTRAILGKLRHKYKVLFHNKNSGKGSAIKTALKNATGDIILIQDADLEYNPNDYKVLLKPILNKQTKVVYGSRFIGKPYKKWSSGKNIIRSHLIGNKLLSLITQMLYFRKVTDMETCYKVFRKEVIKDIKLKSKRFDFEPEITSKILRRGYKIIEVPISFNPRTFEEGKKITWKDGVKALFAIIKYRFEK